MQEGNSDHGARRAPNTVGAGAKHLHPSGAEIKKGYSNISMTPYVFGPWGRNRRPSNLQYQVLHHMFGDVTLFVFLHVYLCICALVCLCTEG